MYWCFSAPEPDPFFLIRTHAEPMAMAETLRKKLREIEPGRAVFDVKPLGEHMGDAFAQNRLRTALLALFAATAVSRASLGLYGTLSYFVTVRRRETGVRLALGALRSQIVKRFVLEGLGVASLGSLAGLALAAGFTRALAGILVRRVAFGRHERRGGGGTGARRRGRGVACARHSCGTPGSLQGAAGRVAGLKRTARPADNKSVVPRRIRSAFAGGSALLLLLVPCVAAELPVWRSWQAADGMAEAFSLALSIDPHGNVRIGQRVDHAAELFRWLRNGVCTRAGLPARFP